MIDQEANPFWYLHLPILKHIMDHPYQDRPSIVGIMSKHLRMSIREPILALEELDNLGCLDIGGWDGTQWVKLSPYGGIYLGAIIAQVELLKSQESARLRKRRDSTPVRSKKHGRGHLGHLRQSGGLEGF